MQMERRRVGGRLACQPLSHYPIPGFGQSQHPWQVNDVFEVVLSFMELQDIGFQAYSRTSRTRKVLDEREKVIFTVMITTKDLGLKLFTSES